MFWKTVTLVNARFLGLAKTNMIQMKTTWKGSFPFHHARMTYNIIVRNTMEEAAEIIWNGNVRVHTNNEYVTYGHTRDSGTKEDWIVSLLFIL
jgi:hypothetical protein